jgi:hypothetical protein
MNQHAMQDPTKLYPHPKSEEQVQSPLGLAKDMSPKPAIYGVAGGHPLP